MNTLTVGEKFSIVHGSAMLFLFGLTRASGEETCVTAGGSRMTVVSKIPPGVVTNTYAESATVVAVVRVEIRHDLGMERVKTMRARTVLLTALKIHQGHQPWMTPNRTNIR